ncbi:DUF4857 domain-containing protein [Campylobacter sp. MOP51]|uniref:DUF4857 domain-containing protein n=1 Tax=Campylobacter canis TaxID=3378588 RepID=UPI003C364AD5
MRALNLIVLVFLSILLSYFLPIFANLLLEEKIVIERVRYSPVVEEFLYSKNDRETKQNTFEIIGKGEISEDKFIEYQPFAHYSLLLSKGTFPSKFEQYGQNPKLIRQNSQNLNLKYGSNKAKYIPLYILLQTDERYNKIIYPPRLLRLAEHGIEIVNLEKNIVDDNSSKILNNDLVKNGFSFPAKMYFSNPSSLKPFDEGAFIIDANDTIFHIKQEKDFISVKNTKLVKPSVINIVVSEDPRKEFYALLVSKTELGLIDYNYNFIKLDNSGYDPFSANLGLRITPVNKILSFGSNETIKTDVMDLNYTTLKQNLTELTPPESKRYIKEYVLPFELKLSQVSHYYAFSVDKISIKGILFSACLAFAYFLYELFVNRRKRFLRSSVVAVFGVYGLLSVFLYKDSD